MIIIVIAAVVFLIAGLVAAIPGIIPTVAVVAIMRTVMPDVHALMESRHPRLDVPMSIVAILLRKIGGAADALQLPIKFIGARTGERTIAQTMSNAVDGMTVLPLKGGEAAVPIIPVVVLTVTAAILTVVALA